MSGVPIVGNNPWDSAEGRFDRPSSSTPRPESSAAPVASMEPPETYRGVESILPVVDEGYDVVATVSDGVVTLRAAADPTLKSFVDRLMRLRAERSDIAADIAEVGKEAENYGYSKKVLTVLCRRLEKDPVEIANGDMLLALYEDELGLSPSARVLVEKAGAAVPPPDKPPPRKETARQKALREARAWASRSSTARH